jgi:hypothetical protein
MVILSLPSMSNSFLGHPDKSEFSAATGKAALIQIKDARQRTDCRSDRSLCRQFFIPSSNRCTADRRTYRLRRISRLRTKILLSRPNLPGPDKSGATDIDSRAQIASVTYKPMKQARTTLPSSQRALFLR